MTCCFLVPFAETCELDFEVAVSGCVSDNFVGALTSFSIVLAEAG